MNLVHNYIILIILLFAPSAKGAENLFLYKGTFNRSIKIEDLNYFKETKIPSKKLTRLMKITNLKEKELHKFLSFKIEVPLKTSSKLMNSNNIIKLYFNFIYWFTPAATLTNLTMPFSDVFFINPKPIL